MATFLGWRRLDREARLARTIVEIKGMPLIQALRQPPRKIALVDQRRLLSLAAQRIEQLEGLLRALRIDVPPEEHNASQRQP
jgi:hypothetical protein